MSRKKDISAIWAIWNNAGMAKEDLYTVIKHKYEKDRMSFMTDPEISDLRAFVSKKPVNLAAVFRVDEKELRMTIKQWWKIKRQLHDLGWDMQAFKNWIANCGMVKYWGGVVEDIYPDEARGIITALEKMRDAKQLKEFRKEKKNGLR